MRNSVDGGCGGSKSGRDVITQLSCHHLAWGHPELHSQGYIAIVAVLFSGSQVV